MKKIRRDVKRREKQRKKKKQKQQKKLVKKRTNFKFKSLSNRKHKLRNG